MRREPGRVAGGDDGFALVGLVVAIFIVLLLLAVAAPRVARELRREKELESARRADQYVRAIRRYYMKLGHYPASIEQLQKTNNIRYLRQDYIDPLTGKSNWRLIHLGENKTTVKGFFGQPLAGLATTGLGSASGLASPGIGTAGSSGTSSGSAFGSPGVGSSGSTFGSSSSSAFGSSAGSGAGSGFGSSATGTGSGTSSSGGVGSTSATDFQGSKGAFLGVGTAATGSSILDLNEQTTYETWEFLYDPRIEQMKAKASLFGGGVTSTSATGLGSASGMASPGIGSGSGTGSGTNSNSPGGSTGTTPSTTPQ